MKVKENQLQALKRFCGQCWPAREECDPTITNNPEEPFECYLFKYKDLKAMGKYKKRILRAEREHCLFCCNRRSEEVALCIDQECALYMFRNGIKSANNVQSERVENIIEKVS